MPYNAEQNEQEILKYWKEHDCFKKSVESRPEGKPYFFYDGPPFATGLPHYGHIVASLIKDIVPRFWTMKGYRVERKWGWDCHGLPIENIIEKELNLHGKKEIEDFGVAKFNEACSLTVMKYANEWKKTISRMGRWVDMEADYKTMDITFMESVWWVFGELWKKGLIYKGHKAMHVCPRCSTPLSNFEVTQGYKDVKDISVTAKFKVKNPEKAGLPENTYILAWTTTPWTLPGNVLLALNEEVKYCILSVEGEEGAYAVAQDRVEEVFKDKKYKILKTLKGLALVGLEYEPLFPYFADTPKAFRVVTADFVTTQDGTGVVHIAPAFGQDDYDIGKREEVPLVQHVGMDGRFVSAVVDFAGQEVKPTEDPTKTDVEIIKWLAHNGKLFSKEKFEHSYPHCWRCDAPLLNYATSSWFVKVAEMKEQLLKNNQEINWVPEHIKEGRFGEWLKGAHDWAISRSRYWGTPLPVWESEDGEVLCVSSVEELSELTGEKITNLHKHIVDNFIIKKDGKEYKHVPEVLDCWFESGSMPYGQMHYPFENKEKFEASFPAEFIAEGQDQTRGWFYTLHVLATALTSGKNPSIPVKKSCPAFKNVIVNGIVLAEDGKKMSKRLSNYPEPGLLLEKYGADAMRYYLAISPVMEAESMNFSENGVREMYNKVVNTLWNVVEFYQMYGSEKSVKMIVNNPLDKWILAKLQNLIMDATKGMEEYRLVEASRPIVEFITELSQWYVRRSRDRFKGENEDDKATAVAVLGEVLLTLSKIMAPFTPFVAEKIYLSLGGKMESVHLERWPEVNKKFINKKVLDEMDITRKAVEMGLSLRAEKTIKVRQPLSKLFIRFAPGPQRKKLDEEYLNIVAEELNVKEVLVVKDLADSGNLATKEDGEISVSLDVEITEDLRQQGIVREIVRSINQMRKERKLTMNDRVRILYETDDPLLIAVIAEYSEEIKKSILADTLEAGSGGEEQTINGAKILINLA